MKKIALLGDPSKAKENLVWESQITVEEMCAEMVLVDLENTKRHALLKEYGQDVSILLEN